jgi:hypothetical protein
VNCTFTYTGSEQMFTVPASVYWIQVFAIGAAGGNDSTIANGGAAEEAIALAVSVTPGATLYVEVGGTGLPASAAVGQAGQAGGFNGGGAGAGSDPLSTAPASGGGASDVRTISSADANSLASRLVVAGGGGGAASCGAGGDAGQSGAYNTSVGCTGSASSGGGAGTAYRGGALGAAPATAGELGLGGAGGPMTPPLSATGDGGGGGGGGWYGGGGGGPAAGGGGGSSHVPPPEGFTSLAIGSASVSIRFYEPTLFIATHPNITVDATSAAGAVVHYTAPAVTDLANPTDPPKAVCTPTSGSTFPIGTTRVTCTATDAADYNSPDSSSFTVTVVGAPGQLHVLHYAVRDYGPALANTVLIAEHAVGTGNTPRACLALDAFVVEVATRIPPFPPVTRAHLIAAAAQIQAVLACGDSWLP